MSGVIELADLLARISPDLDPQEYVFCSINPQDLAGLELSPRCRFDEQEGVTVILTRQEAESNALHYTCPSRLITLRVHSSLHAVGFLAAICTLLASHGISVNVVSACFHDHLFVPIDRAGEAMELLKTLPSRGQQG